MGDSGELPTELLPSATSSDSRPSSANEPITAERFGKYEVLSKAGQGGFGVVFRGRDPVLQRTVAIKTCSTRDEKLRQRFFREGKIAAGLQHANVTTIHDLGVEGDLPYLVQEFLAGEDLDDLITGETELTTSAKIDILLQIARGLEYAHQAGVLHRDVKPSNIRVLDDGTVKIMDFGIAKLLHAETQLTGTGMTMGTVGYLAPEQLRSEELDERADIFSFGVLAFELLTGRRPFRGEDFSQISYQLLYVDPPSIRELWPECPARLGAVVSRCLAKDKVGRYPDFSQVIADLEPLYDLLRTGSQPMDARTWEMPSAAPLPTREHEAPKKRGIPTGAVVLALLAAFGLGAWWFGTDPVDSGTETEDGIELAAGTTPAVETEQVAVSTTPVAGGTPAQVDPPPQEPAPAPERVAVEEDPPVREDPPRSREASPPPTEMTIDDPVVSAIPESPEAPPPVVAGPSVEPAVIAEVEEDEARVSEIEGVPEIQAPPPEIDTTPRMTRGDLINPGPGVVEPRLVERPDPVYPRRARRQRQEARVVVRVLVDENGRVLQAIVAASDPYGFGAAAKEAALAAHFEAPTKEGIAGKMWTEMPFEFRLK